jgi:hypothetical protein
MSVDVGTIGSVQLDGDSEVEDLYEYSYICTLIYAPRSTIQSGEHDRGAPYKSSLFVWVSFASLGLLRL